MDPDPTAADATTDRQRAVTRLKKRQDFHTHLLVFVLVNAGTVAIWFATGAQGTFWPMFLMVAWGIGIVLNAWDVYGRRELTEDQIQHEVSKLRRLS